LTEVKQYNHVRQSHTVKLVVKQEGGRLVQKRFKYWCYLKTNTARASPYLTNSSREIGSSGISLRSKRISLC